MMKKHVSWIEVVEEMASESWGAEVEDVEKFKHEIAKSPERLAAYSILAFLKRLTNAQFTPRKTSNEDVLPDEYTEKYPDVAVGDILWCGDLYDGFVPHVVVGKDNEGRCRIAKQSRNDGTYSYRNSVYWASTGYYPSLREAVAAATQKDADYYSRRIEMARKAIADYESSEDLTEYIGEDYRP